MILQNGFADLMQYKKRGKPVKLQIWVIPEGAP